MQTITKQLITDRPHTNFSINYNFDNPNIQIQCTTHVQTTSLYQRNKVHFCISCDLLLRFTVYSDSGVH